MNIVKITMAFSFLVCISCTSTDEIVLSRTSIGNMPLKQGAMISLDLVEQNFPDHEIVYRVQSGDSPDFHYILVLSKDEKLIFSIKSFFDDEINETSKEFDIDILTTSSPDVIDEFGIKVGDSIDKVIRSRGQELDIVANHFDNSIGKEPIFYQFYISLTPEEINKNSGINHRDPEKVTLEDAIRKNPAITSMSWPWPRWE